MSDELVVLVNVRDIDAEFSKYLANEHRAVTLFGPAFAAHDSYPQTLVMGSLEPGDALPERGELFYAVVDHFAVVIACRVVGLTAQSLAHIDILESCLRRCLLQRVHRKLGLELRVGPGANVNQVGNVMGLEHDKEGVERTGAVADREDGNLVFPRGWKHDNKPVRVQLIIHRVVVARKRRFARDTTGAELFCES